MFTQTDTLATTARPQDDAPAGPPPLARADATRALREVAELPGPPGLPFLGNMLQIDKAHIHRQVEGWAKLYGPYFTFRLGRQRLFVVADNAAMGAVMRDRPDGFRRTKRMRDVAAEIGLDAGVFSAEGDVWRRQRRMVMAGFDPRHLRAYFPSLVKVSGRLEARWCAAAASGAPIDLQADLMRFTVDAISGLAFGADVNTLGSDDDVIQNHLDKIFPALFRRLFEPLSLHRWFKSAADRALDRSVAEVNRAIDGFVAAARARLAGDPERRAAPRNLLEAMIVAADDPGSGITDAEVSGNVMTMLLAGEDTTANTLAWCIWLLHTHPDCLARARAEVDAQAGDRSGWTPERFAAMPYLDACANETMRLKPIAPVLILQAIRDSVVADIRVPKGTLVFGALRPDAMRDDHFENAAVFEPQRWLRSQSGHDASSASRVSMPFGAGPRVCPGRHLALLEMKIALATLLGRFELESVTTADGTEPDELMSFTMTPSCLAMRLRERGLPA